MDSDDSKEKTPFNVLHFTIQGLLRWDFSEEVSSFDYIPMSWRHTNCLIIIIIIIIVIIIIAIHDAISSPLAHICFRI